MPNIWKTLQKPILALAPMEDVTDTVFRRIVLKTGKPSIFFTEFTNVDGLIHPKGQEEVAKRLRFYPQEKPLIAQIWGTSPENFYKASAQIAQMGFDGIDINMGCPQRDITKFGACAALIKTPELAKDIIDAVRDGIKDGGQELPVSVKTRIGFKQIETEKWLGFLLEQNLDAISVHGRTAKEQSLVPAHWDEIKKFVELKNIIAPSTIVLGNGDVKSYPEALNRVEESGVDGVMIGRGIFHNPWIFDQNIVPENVPQNERLKLLVEHVTLYESEWGAAKNFQVLKRFFKIYINGFSGAAEMRDKFMQTNNSQEAIQLAQKYLTLYN